jgi:transmembrane sensor
MSELDDSRENADLEREALARVRHLVSGMATSQDVEETRRWRCQSPAHADALAFATRLWDRLGPAGRNVLQRRGEQVLPDRPATVQQRLTRRVVLGGAVAATAAYVIVRPPLQLWPALSELGADYRTATGEQRWIALADGASVQLNTRTSIKLRASAGDDERIELISGEAAIATGRQLTRPLVVIAGDATISSLSASFNVRHDSNAPCVTCQEGAVQVQRRGAALTLRAGQQVTFGERGVDAPVAVDATAVAAWQEGLLVFHQTPLSDVVSEINRYRPGKILVMNAELGRRPVNARFRVGNVDEIMSLAQRIFGAKITALPGGFVVLS